MDNKVMVELDYKGSYSRGVMTIEDFQSRFPNVTPTTEGDTHTFRLLVHIWFELYRTEQRLNEFLSDMEDGLPQSDIDSGNLAYLDKELFSEEYMHLFEKYSNESEEKI